MKLPRRVCAELLDELPADDPRAVRSRRDLRRVNRLMGNHSILLRALDRCSHSGSLRLVELGAGDGTLALRIARSRSRAWPGAALTLVDLQPSASDETLDEIRALGWSAQAVTADALDWLDRPAADSEAVLLANLFVHHFEGDRLARLLRGIARRARAFVCCEPQRSRTALGGSHLLGLIGCNAVTRHDAVASVHAGFRDRELTAAWDEASRGIGVEWRVDESGAGIFSHSFVARNAG